MNSLVSSFFEDIDGWDGHLDSRPSSSLMSVDLHVGFGGHPSSFESRRNDIGKNLGQSCQSSPIASPTWVTAGGSPCPCDRWCESLACYLIEDIHDPFVSSQSQSKSPKYVRFAPHLEIFEYDETDDCSSFLKHYWLDGAPVSSDGVDAGGSVPLECDQHVSVCDHAFWDFWHCCWQQSGLNGPPCEDGTSFDVTTGYESGLSWAPDDGRVHFRPENNPPLAIIAHPVDDAADFTLALDDEGDHGNDLGVSFARWQDLALFVDLPPLLLAETIPFITFGLRNVPLGRRDFASPDLSPSRLRELIWQLWQDEVPQFEDVVIHFVRPQPIQELGCPGTIVLLVEIVGDMTPQGMSPFLAMTCDSHDRLVDIPQAQYTPQVTDTIALQQLCPMAHLCVPNGFRQCQVSVAGATLGAGPVVVIHGSLVKWTISARLQIFATAAAWFPDVERFAARVREAVRAGIQVHALELLIPHGVSRTVNFRLPDLFRPSRFRQLVASSCEFADPTIFPVVDDALDIANPVPGSHLHAIVIPEAHPGVAFAVVTQVLASDGMLVASYTQVVYRDDYLDLSHLHQHLCGQFQLDSTLSWSFGCRHRDLHNLHAVALAETIIHTIHSRRDDDTPDMQVDPDSLPPVGEDSDDSVGTDSLSLLQLQAVRGRSLLLLQHGMSNHQVDVHPAVEDVERSEIALKLPHRFGVPLAWLNRRPYELEGTHADIEIIVDPFRPHGFVDVLCECLHLDDTTLVPQTLRVMRLPRACTWGCLVRSLDHQIGVPLSYIESIRFDGSPWFLDSDAVVADGAHCQVILSELLDTDTIKLGVVPVCSPAGGLDQLRTYVVDLPHLPARIDVVGSYNLEPLMDLFRSLACWPTWVRLHQVQWDPNDLEPCRTLYLLASAPVDDAHVPMLVVSTTNERSQSWQICYLPPRYLLAAVACRFPASQPLCTTVDGHDSWSLPVISAPGTCVCCDTLVVTSPPVDFSFVQGMKDLLDWMSTTPDCTAPQAVSFGSGEAPCPCDRWCADPPPPDLQPESLLSSSMSTASHAVPLSLVATIPDPHICNESPPVKIPLVRSTFLGTAIANLNVRLCPELPDGLKVHRSTAIEFLKQSPSCVSSSAGCVSRHELYIDGSATLDYCSWALAHVHLLEDGTRRFVGILAGNVTLDPDSLEWIGAQQLDNIAAELTAICVAHAYAVSLQAPCCIRPDLSFGHDLVRRQVTSKHNLNLAKLCTALGRDQYVPIEEVRAHRGDPYNELADSIAKWVGRQGISLGCFDFAPLHSFVQNPHDLDWAWLSHIGPAFQLAMPQVDHLGTVHVTPAVDPITYSPPVRDSSPLQPEWCVSLQVATANVQSARAKSSGAGTRCHSLTKRFDQQWSLKEIDVIGVQEARTPQGQDLSQHYAIYCSGVDISQGSAHFGCEIWIRRNAVLATTSSGDTIRLSSCKVVVHLADPRRLILVLTYDSFRLVVASLHAPCLSSHHSLDDIAEWWRITTSSLASMSSDHCIICVDANAPLGRVELPLTGDYGAEPENAQSEIFRTFLEAMHLTVPCTFSDCHDGESGTWKHPTGAMCRRDYVLLSLPLKSWAVRSFILDDFDRARAHVDHLPSVLCLCGCLQGLASSSKICWDPDKLRDPQVCEQFRQALATLPLPCWSIAADDHCRLWEDQFFQVAAQFFKQDQPSNKKRRRPSLSRPTLDLIQFKRHVLGLARHADGILYEEYKEVLREVEKQVRSCVARDQRAWFDDLIQRVQESGELHNSAHMFKLLRRLGSRKYKTPRRPLPMLRKADGSYTASVPEMQEVFREQFAALEGGVQTSYDQLRKDHHCHDLLPAAQVDPGMLISPWDLAQAISRMKRGKVPGKNGITTELLKCAGDVAATQLVPLIMKCVMHQFEPLSWKGGTLVPLFKGKGRVDCPKAYRSIFISDTTAKAFHSCLRSRLLKTWERVMCSLQFGGRPGYGTDVAHHYAHAFLSWSRHVATPSALIFLDLAAAFYSVLRQGLFQHDICDEHLCYAFRSLGISPDDLREVIHTVTTEAAVEGVSMHCDLVLKGLFEATHFSMDGVPGVTHTSKGTRPGDPIADLLFNMAMRLIQRSVQRKLDACQLQDLAQRSHGAHLLGAPALPTQGYAAVAYVDDVVIMAHAATNEAVRHMTQLIVSTYYDEARHRGLLMNFEAKKTEAILQPVGKGTRAFKDHWMRQMQGKLPVLTETSLHHLTLVFKYRHLGTQIQHGADIAADSREKAALARQAWGPLARSFFRKRAVSLNAKVTVFRSLVMSRLMYNSHVWSWWRDEPVRAWSNVVRSMAADMLGSLAQGVRPFQLATEELCALAGFLSPQLQVHIHRLMYVKRLIAKGPSLLWAYLWSNTSDRAWMSQLQNSLDWMRLHYPGHIALPPDCSTQEWISYIAVDEQWKGKVKKAGKSALAHLQLNAQGKVWQLSMIHRLEQVECAFPTSVPRLQGRWQCELCQLQFKSRRALAMHSSKVHGYTRRSRYFIDGDECHACRKKYFTLARALTHLDHNPQCAAHLDACFGPLPDEDVANTAEQLRVLTADLKSAGWQATKAFFPVARISGPPLPPIGSADIAIMRAKWDAKREGGTGHHQMAGFAVTPDLNDRPHGNDAHCPFGPFVMNTYGGKIGGQLGCAQEWGLSFLCAQINVRSLFFVHFFSGFRRRGDLQHWLENEIVGEGYTIYCVSVDICLCRNNFDLTAKEALDFWVGKAKDGFVVGGGGGPPCETVSAARFAGPGPQPVRSGQHFWGRPGNTKKQNCQVGIGTRLLMFLLEFLQEMVVAGLCGFLEHPAFPVWLAGKDPPSIWALDCVRALARLSCVQVTTIDQCAFGCVAVKPTTFLLVRLSDLQRKITLPGLRGRCNHRRGSHTVLAGKDDKGNFHTAKAKIYPKLLNQTLASGIRDFVAHVWADRNGAPEQHPDLDALRTFEFIEDAVVQPDYHA